MGQSGGKIEFMGTINGVLNLFCAVIMLLLWGGLLQQQPHKPTKEVRYFRYLLFTAFVMMLLESFAWLVLLPHDGWFRFVAMLASILFFAFLGLYTRYVYSLLRLRSGWIYRLVQMIDLFCATAAVLLAANFIHPFFYDYRTQRFLHPAGTAAVISPVGVLGYKNHDMVIGGGKIGPFAQKMYDYIEGLHIGEVEDKYGFIETVAEY